MHLYCSYIRDITYVSMIFFIVYFLNFLLQTLSSRSTIAFEGERGGENCFFYVSPHANLHECADVPIHSRVNFCVTPEGISTHASFD